MIDAERITSYQVWADILTQHPEIDLVSTTHYSPVPHREAGDLRGDHKPWTRNYGYKDWFISVILAHHYWNDRPNVELYGRLRDKPFGLHSIVGIGIDRHEDMEAGIIFPPIPKKERSFLFVDFEIPVTAENEERIDKTVEAMGIAGGLIRSDFSYHFASSELSTLEALPVRYGKFINAFAADDSRWEWVREIGNALIEAKDREEVKETCDYILNTVGHYGAPEGKWFIVDLRYIAHSLLDVPTLRISTKRGYTDPPTLIKWYEGRKRREEGLEPIGKVIKESDIFCWMKPSVPKST